MTVTQDHGSLTIRPEIGWAVADEKGERAKGQKHNNYYKDV